MLVELFNKMLKREGKEEKREKREKERKGKKGGGEEKGREREEYYFVVYLSVC